MRAIILAAGYATRLYPLTADFPKPLLEMGGSTILDLLMDQLAGIDGLREIILITNSRFFQFFHRWRDRRPQADAIRLLDDGSTCNDDRRGALGDMRLALEHAGPSDDALITAADNILQFELMDFVAAFRARGTCQICVHRIEDQERLRRTGVATLGAEDRVVGFQEKPREPKSSWAVPPLYLFPRKVLPRILTHLSAGGSGDAPGNLIEWLWKEEPLFAHRIRGSVLDIGTPESLDAARRMLLGPSQP